MDKTEQLAQPVTIEIDNMRLFGMYHPPAGSKPSPAVLILHGFGGNKCGKHRMYVAIARALAEAGIAALRIDFRGCGDSDGDWHDLSIAGQVSDSLQLLDWLAQRPEVQADNLGILGRSFGGAIALQTAEQHGKLRALALWAPVFSPEPWRPYWEAHREQIEALGKGAPLPFQGELTTQSFVHEFFELDLVKSLESLAHVPLLHIHGGQDQVVTPDHADGYRRLRAAAPAETHFLFLEKCDHDFTDPFEQQTLVQETCNWYVRMMHD